MANNMIACRKSFTDTLLELARQDKDIVAVTTDARGSVTLGDFAKELPAQLLGMWNSRTGCGRNISRFGT